MATERFREFIKRGDALYYFNRYKQAIAEYEKAAAEDGNSVFPIHRIGYCYYLLGEMDKAAEINKVAFEKEPGYYYNFYLDGIIKIATNRSFEGIKSLLKSLETNPEYTPPYSALAQVYFKNNYPETSIKYAKQGLTIDPSVVRCHTALCGSYAKLKKRELFLNAAETALRMAPDNAEVHQAIGWGYSQFEYYTEAKKHYNEALRLNPNSGTDKVLQPLGFLEAHSDYDSSYIWLIVRIGVLIIGVIAGIAKCSSG